MPAIVSRRSSRLRLSGRGLLGAAVALLFASAPASAQTSTYEQLQTFSGLLSQIRLNYVDSVTTAHLVRGAIDGMLGSLDPHSYFLGGEDAGRLEAWRAGRLAATGIEVEEAEGVITVSSVYPRSPAANAGVAPGDRIVAIDDSTVAGLSGPKVQTLLIGEKGTRVRIKLERGSRLEPETVSVRVRNDDIRPVSVTVARTLPGDIGYVRLVEFLPESAREVQRAIDHVVHGHQGRLILDLRGNPGGAVIAAVEIASLFFPKGQVVFRVRGRRHDIAHDYLTEHDGDYKDLQLIVLIDEHSASASEALTGSLQDHDRALVLGRRSFGKALMQMPFPVPPNNDAVWLTVGYILTPNGRLIQRRYAGLTKEQYYDFAGRTGAAADTANVYHTDGGRPIRGGGGIEPDSVLPSPAALPVWWVAAADSGYLTTVADSVAGSLAAPMTQDVWASSPAEWRTRLMPPLLTRARSRLGIRGDVDSAAQARMARALASRVAEVRWGVDADDDLRLRSDADIAAALTLFPKAAALLHNGGH
ncbi:MAG TPA: S41 family peptidase [Gemmatimonadales bacterium]|jgi:carboxyl-terminal processing protease